MASFEYTSIVSRVAHTGLAEEDRLNQLGGQGWRVSHVTPARDETHVLVLMERELPGRAGVIA